MVVRYKFLFIALKEVVAKNAFGAYKMFASYFPLAQTFANER